MKASLKSIDDHGLKYKALLFVCPGCEADPDGGSGLHMLAVNSSEKNPSWRFNGDLERPTLSPSILTKYGPDGTSVCHSFLVDGTFQFLPDSTHPLSGKHVPIPDLPDWAVKEE